jgi:hypothetical protein
LIESRPKPLLTNRPDNRRPLDWERNQIDLLMMEGRVFDHPDHPLQS